MERWNNNETLIAEYNMPIITEKDLKWQNGHWYKYCLKRNWLGKQHGWYIRSLGCPKCNPNVKFKETDEI